VGTHSFEYSPAFFYPLSVCMKPIWLLFPLNLRISLISAFSYISFVCQEKMRLWAMTNIWWQANELYSCHFTKQSRWQLVNMLVSFLWACNEQTLIIIYKYRIRRNEVQSNDDVTQYMYERIEWLSFSRRRRYPKENNKLIWIVNNIMCIDWWLLQSEL
jgi:hypothetical protein